MKVALLTIWHEKNYGAELQAYATIKILQDLGHKVEMINIRLSDCRKGNLKQKIYNIICNFTPGHRKFSNFWNKYIPVTRRYKTVEQLQKDPPKADMYIVGSDQVWNPELTKEFTLLYFLNFAEPSTRRISFASSFGSTTWKYPELKQQVEQLLKKFSYLTCREKSGVELLKKEFGIESTNVVDPTLVLGNYTDLVPTIQQKDTLVYYPLGTDLELEKNAIKLANDLNLIPIKNNDRTILPGGLEWNRVGIEEWIKNIAESNFVLTRSFHGLVFSLLFHRQFAIIASPNGRNNRITDLLYLLGLSERFFDVFESLYKSKPWSVQINYEEVDKKLDRLRKDSINELKTALNS